MEIKWQVHTRPCSYKFSDKRLLQLPRTRCRGRQPGRTSPGRPGSLPDSPSTPAILRLGSTVPVITGRSHAVSRAKFCFVSFLLTSCTGAMT